jgi:DnaJ-class molecular chaperone
MPPRSDPRQTISRYCPKCEGDGSYSELADCTTFDKDCACNFSRITVDPCPECAGTGEVKEVPDAA